VLNLLDLKDGLGNPNNLVTIYDRGKYGLEKAGDGINMNIQGDQIKINTKNITYPELTSDGLAKEFPGGYGYRTFITANGDQQVMPEQPTKKSSTM